MVGTQEKSDNQRSERTLFTKYSTSIYYISRKIQVFQNKDGNKVVTEKGLSNDHVNRPSVGCLYCDASLQASAYVKGRITCRESRKWYLRSKRRAAARVELHTNFKVRTDFREKQFKVH